MNKENYGRRENTRGKHKMRKEIECEFRGRAVYKEKNHIEPGDFFTFIYWRRTAIIRSRLREWNYVEGENGAKSRILWLLMASPFSTFLHSSIETLWNVQFQDFFSFFTTNFHHFTSLKVHLGVFNFKFVYVARA